MNLYFQFPILFLFTFWFSSLSAQVSFTRVSPQDSIPSFDPSKTLSPASKLPALQSVFKAPRFSPSTSPNDYRQNAFSTYNYHHLPIFCKFEADLEKNNGLPIKMRLGTVQHVDYLERKRGK